MDSYTSYNNMSDFSNKENIKIEILDIFLDLYKDSDIDLDSGCKDFILSNTEEYLEEYGKNDSYLTTTKFENNKGEYEGEYVKIDEVDDLIKQFQYNLAKLLIKVISYDLSIYLAKREGNI